MHFKVDLLDFEKRKLAHQMYGKLKEEVTKAYDSYVQKQYYVAQTDYHSANVAITDELQKLPFTTTE